MRKISAAVLCVVVLASCSQKAPKCRYVVDLRDNIKDLILDDAGNVSKLQLETNYLASVGQKGRGPGEYIGISSYYVCDDTVSIYSNGSKSIQHYIFKDSVFTHTKTSYVPDTLMFTLIVTSDNFFDRYITHNTYHGIGGVVPSLSIYDRDFNHIASSTNTIPLGGRYYTSPFSINQYGVCFTDF